jgi:HK97 family phage major capsid protein
VTLGTGSDIYDDIMAEGGVLSQVEQDGFAVTGHVAALSMKARLRGLRDANGMPIFSRTPQAATPYELDGVPVDFPTNGSIDPAQSLLISGDYQQAMYSIRQDVTYKVLDQAVIQDGSGAIIYNLAQQDMVALRVTMRLGWQLPNPANRVNAVAATRYPFAVLLPAG